MRIRRGRLTEPERDDWVSSVQVRKLLIHLLYSPLFAWMNSHVRCRIRYPGLQLPISMKLGSTLWHMDFVIRSSVLAITMRQYLAVFDLDSFDKWWHGIGLSEYLRTWHGFIIYLFRRAQLSRACNLRLLSDYHFRLQPPRQPPHHVWSSPCRASLQHRTIVLGAVVFEIHFCTVFLNAHQRFQLQLRPFFTSQNNRTLAKRIRSGQQITKFLFESRIQIGRWQIKFWHDA